VTLQEVAQLVGSQEDLAPEHRDLVITGPASLDDAGPGEISFCGSPKYLKKLLGTRASACLVPKGFSEAAPPALLRVENPAATFAKILEHFAPQPLTYAPGVHPSAVVAADVRLGDGVHVGANAVIEAGASLGARTIVGAGTFIGHGTRTGEDCFFYPHVTILERSILGHRVTLHSGVVIGSDGFGYEFQNGHHQKIPQTGIVEIADDVEIGANSTVDRARFGRTRILRGTKIDNLVQVAHNVTIGEHSILCAQVGISGSTRLGSYVTLAGKVGVNGHIEIGDAAIVSAMAGVTKSVPPKTILAGLPARPLREFKQNNALLRNIHKLYERVRVLEEQLAASQES